MRRPLLLALLSAAPFLWHAQVAPLLLGEDEGFAGVLWRREWCVAVRLFVSPHVAARSGAFIAKSSCGGSVVRRDDGKNFLENTRILSLSSENVSWMFRDGVLIGVYEPLSLLLKAIITHIASADRDGQGINILPQSPRAYLASALALHAVTAAMACGWIDDLVRLATGRRNRRRGGHSDTIASFTVVALFGIHPLRTEVLFWPSATPYALSGLCCLASARSHARGIGLVGFVQHTSVGASSDLEGTHTRVTRAMWTALSVVAYAAAVLSKSAALPLPAALVCVDVALARTRHKSAGDYSSFGGLARALITSLFSIAHIPLFAVAVLGARAAVMAAGPGSARLFSADSMAGSTLVLLAAKAARSLMW
jgi:hypothetical protein